ncbi:hypothetical protein ACFWCF_05145 [Rhodococcus sp. NPDC060090]|uniref:hypothetical protein n=1 Tax=Rhodococcus sp. NPDC060090 TaxID=3347056 RepID=UPI00364696F3
MAQQITRAKSKIRAARIPFRVPAEHELPERIDAVRAALYLIYDQLYAVAPTPVVALHRAVAVAEVDDPAAALAIVHSLALDHYYVAHAARAIARSLSGAINPP